MYGRGSAGMLKANATGAAGSISILGGASVLPNTSGNTLLTVLTIATIVLGALVLMSFVVSRIVTRRYSK